MRRGGRKMKELDNLKALGIENPYVYLQIKESATDVEIKRAFRELAKRYAYDENRQCDGHYLRHPYVKPTTKKFITFFEVFRAAS